MNKVICDVCGTAYPETANQCPICGCAKVASQAASADTGAEETTAYSYVKGGRFSKKNVKARSQKGKFHDGGNSRNQNADEEKTNKGLVAVVILLLVAIVGVVIYIGVQFFDLGQPDPTDPPMQTNPSAMDSQPGDTQGSSDPSGVTGTPCTNILLSNGTLEFLAVGDKWTLEVELTPVDCTEAVVFTSADESVATVSQTGEVVAVGAGETVVTATCGSVSAECKIQCNFPGATEPSQPTNPIDPNFTFEFDTRWKDDQTGYYDITLKVGDTWRTYKRDMTVAPEDITWVSDDISVCTIENGIATMVGTGNTKIHAQYNGKTVTCIVRVKPGEGNANSSTGDGEDAPYTISHKDVTLNVGTNTDKFDLVLKDADGNTVDVEWTADKDGYVTIKGNRITGVKNSKALPNGYVLVSATVDGTKYSCKVRVN